MTAARRFRSVVALSGGVGGARFVDGLSRALDPESLTIVVNTGDDLVHWGLYVCPDLDTVMYTLSGLADEDRGWGLRGETFAALEKVRRFGGEDWFMLGDRDLATHLVRTEALARGESLSAVTARLASAVGIRCRLLPMADQTCSTMIDTAEHGTLPFQKWFVMHRAPSVRRVWFDGDPPATDAVMAAIESADLVVIGPSNPYVSIDPILSRPGMRALIATRPVIAVSPIVGGKAVKGPLAEMIPALAGVPPSATSVAAHYGQLLSGFVFERGDDVSLPRILLHATDTMMRTSDDRLRLARDVLDWAETSL